MPAILPRRVVLSTLGAGCIAGIWQHGFRALPALAANCGASPTAAQTAGPFFSPGTPLRDDFRADGPGRPFDLEGLVLDGDCRPLVGAVVDIWHADADGRYDNDGYRFRGHMVSGPDGRYAFRTIMPGNYGRRTRHIHVTVRTSGIERLTTQLYFPDDPYNASDSIFDPDLIMDVDSGTGNLAGRFDFLLTG